MSSVIQSSDQYLAAILPHIRETIENRKTLQMITTGIQDTYAREAFFSAHAARFQDLQSQAQPLIAALPTLESKLEACNSNLQDLCECLMLASRDAESIRSTTSNLCAFAKVVHTEWELNRSNRSKSH